MYTVIIPSANNSNLVKCLDRLRDPRVIVVREKPFIFAKAINRGIAAAGEDDVVLLNDDALLNTTNGFEEMERLSKEHPEFGVISGAVLGNICCDEQRPKPVHHWEVNHPMVAFVCVYIPRAVIEKVGLLDERFIGYGYDDDDLCRRIRDAGYKLAVCGKCVVEHASLPSTFRSGNYMPNEEYLKKMQFNRTLFQEKWKNPAPPAAIEVAPIERSWAPRKEPPILSILICGVVSRRPQARELINSLEWGSAALLPPGQVEILYACDAGQEKVGAKRNRLLAAAKGIHSCFVDDDDMVTADYAKRMVDACSLGKDCVGISGFVTYQEGNKYLRRFRNSPEFKGRTDNGEIITDRASHLCAIRTEIARQVKFPEINVGEDRQWMDRIFPLLKTWTVIQTPIYLYQFDFTKTCTQMPNDEKARLARCQGGR
jgi:hypothetical protein